VSPPRITIGMIGIGQLGLPIATNLLNAGFRVVGYRRTDRDHFVRAGGEALNSPAEVAAAANVVLLCLPGEDAQRDVLEGPNGLLSHLRPGQTLLETGTYRPEYKQAQAQRLSEVGVRMLEVEISGTPSMVAERRAALYVGGDAGLYDQCLPVLRAITEHQFLLGDIGSAVGMKLIANCLVAVHVLAAAEAVNLGTRAGFDAKVVAEVIRQGAGSSTQFAIRAPMMAERRFSPAPGPFATLEKYIHMGRAFATKHGSAMPLFDAAAPFYERAVTAGMSHDDISGVIRLVEADSKAG
jgi:3-hydroxyisobutyrate dehydrogenase